MLELVNIQLSVGIISQIIGPEFPFVVLSGFEPCHHRVLVGLLCDVLVSPFVVFGVENVEWLVVFLQRVVEVR